MAFTQTSIEIMLAKIVENVNRALPVTLVYTNSLLDPNDLVTAISSTYIVANPSALPLTWGSPSVNAVSTTNSVANGNAINFSCKQTTIATIVFYDSVTDQIVISMDAGTITVTPAYGGPVFFSEFEVQITEAV